MIISVINHTNGEIPDVKVQEAIRAINLQIAYDFELYWSLGATLRLEGKSATKPETADLRDMRGDAVLYLWNGADAEDALGYHEANNRGIPYGFVFTKLAKQLGESWTVTLSHEALELIADPEVNLLVQGPHPSKAGKIVFYWYEMCDAVQAETYGIGGVEVSNFLLPLYFTGQQESGSRNDFLGNVHPVKGKPKDKRSIGSFGINPGGYVGYFDPETGEHQTASRPRDARAKRRLELKSRYGAGRRATRYQRFQEAAPVPRTAKRPKPAHVECPRFVPEPAGVDVLSRTKRRNA